MSFMDNCTAHPGQKATGKCFSCHKPTCPQCNTRDGCCSDACYRGKTQFGTGRVKKLKRPFPWPSLFSLLVVIAGGYALGWYLGYLPKPF